MVSRIFSYLHLTLLSYINVKFVLHFSAINVLTNGELRELIGKEQNFSVTNEMHEAFTATDY